MKALIMISNLLVVPINNVVSHTNNFVDFFLDENISYLTTKKDVLQTVTPINVVASNTLPSNYLFTNYPIKDNSTLVSEAFNSYSDSRNNHHNREARGNNPLIGRLPKKTTSVKKENNE